MVGNAVRRTARSVAFTLAVLVAISLVGVSPVSAGRPLERRLLKRINHARLDRGRPRLELRAWLARPARRHSREMAEAGEWFHTTDLAGQLFSRGWSTLGENVGHAPSVASMHRWFMGSPLHRANILDRDFDRVGLGIVRDEDGALWITEIFAG